MKPSKSGRYRHETALDKPSDGTPGHMADEPNPTTDNGPLFGHAATSGVIALPTPHPLDYEWRFAAFTIRFVLETCRQMTHECDTVALLGAPTLLQAAIEGSYPRQMLLFDKNPALAKCFPSTQSIYCDLISDEVPENLAAVVVADPPWYERQTHAFLWAASRMCQTQGRVLLSLPPLDTRPGVEQERERLLEWAGLLGLRLEQIRPASLSYLSPPFEVNAFKAGGVTDLCGEWRRGDLFIFELHSRRYVPRHAADATDTEWDEIDFSGVRIRIRRSEERGFHDPRLVSIVAGDILPSVSRRDERRGLADAWTSGNRIFRCVGKAVLREVTAAFATGTSPIATVSDYLQQSLTSEEEGMVLKASHQIAEIVRVERAEYVALASGD